MSANQPTRLRHALGQLGSWFASKSPVDSGLAAADDTSDLPERFRLDDPELATSLVDFLRTAGCLALKVEPTVVEAHLLKTTREHGDHKELHAHVSAWRAVQAAGAALRPVNDQRSVLF
jgi:hypothetical protein